MPLVRIEIVKGKTDLYKKELLQAVHDALEKALQIPEWDRYQRLYELEEDNFEWNKDKSSQFTLIDITLFPGRTKEMKGTVIRYITEFLGVRLQIAPEDIFIVMNDPPLENWGIRGKQLGSDQ